MYKIWCDYLMWYKSYSLLKISEYEIILPFPNTIEDIITWNKSHLIEHAQYAIKIKLMVRKHAYLWKDDSSIYFHPMPPPTPPSNVGLTLHNFMQKTGCNIVLGEEGTNLCTQQILFQQFWPILSEDYVFIESTLFWNLCNF